jgi:hypothetical protein
MRSTSLIARRPATLAASLGLACLATAASAAVRCVPDTSIDGACASGHVTIQAGVTAASPGDTVLVGPGTYVEFVTIDRNVVLLARDGRAATTIAPPASPAANLGTVLVTSNTTGLQIGAPGKGFTIQGIDNASPGLESAAVYFQGSHSNAHIRQNEIVAAGDAGLMTEFGATISGFVIDGNVFSGQTFTGATAGDCGFGNQFSAPNVPRQLVVVSGGNGGGSHSNVVFTNNQVTGASGGLNAAGREQGNTGVTIDASGSTIAGNTFSVTTSRFATSLRARGPNTTISANIFNSGGLEAVAAAPVCATGAPPPADPQRDRLAATGHLLVNNVGSTLAQLVAANTFDKGVYVGPVSANGTIALSVELTVSAVLPNTTVEVLPGVYNEQVSITTANLTVNGAGAVIRPSVVFSDTTQGSPCSNGTGTAVVLVSGVSGVVLNDLTVDGSLITAMPTRFVGLYYRNASGRIDGGAVTNIANSPLDGVQNGLGIYVQAKGPTIAAVDTVGVTVSGYQKNGITYNGCGCADTVDGVATGTVSGSTVTGAGAVPVIAQNGVQVGFGAGPVTVTGNTIAGHRYTGDPNNGTGSGILLFSAKNNLVTLNEIADNNNGVAIQGGSFGLCVVGDATANDVTCNRISGHDVFAYEVGVSADAAANAVNDNAILDNATGVDGSAITSGSLDARNNWWGCATGPNTPGCDTTAGAVTAAPFSAAVPGCVGCTANADCNDGLVCNGVETCNVGAAACVAGTAPDCSGFDDQCNAGACFEPGGCAADPLPNTTVCTGPAGDVCSVPDRCDGAGTCADGGGADPDGDDICSVDDNCPTVSNSDQSNIDGEGGGDACDAEDGGLNITKARLKANSAGAGDNSNISLKGDFLTIEPGDVFSAAAPITLVVSDNLGQARSATFLPGECRSTSAKIACTSADRQRKATFKTRAGTGLWRFSIKLKRQSLTAPFQGPVSATLTYDGAIDRTDQVVDCVSSFSQLKCREF